MGWSRNAVLLLAFPAAIVAALAAFYRPAHYEAMSAVACYVALANDIAPLVEPGTPDIAASSPECAPPTAAAPVRAQAATNSRTTIDNANPAVGADTLVPGSLRPVRGGF